MASILCLAHYCDTHGPTPLMVTEGLSVDCLSCLEDFETSRRPSTTSHLSGNTGSLVSGGRDASGTNSALEDKENGAQRATVQKYARSQEPQSALDTPPESPRVIALQTGQNANNYRRDSSFRKTYDEIDKKRAIPCENCALTLPKKREEENPSSPQGANDKVDDNGPILRTRKPYERVAKAIPSEDISPPKSTNSSDSSELGDYNAVLSKSRGQPQQLIRAGTSSSNSSFNSTISHTHFLDYTSTHEPLAATSWRIIRQSCLRTLSCETLPPSLNQATSPTSPFINNPFSTSPAAASTSSGGPIFFGDPLAGYTTAYIFRIPDANARGRRRVYALMALSTHRERLAMQTFSFLSTAFRDLADWIQHLAEMELERCENVNSPLAAGPNNNTPTSSFLSGRNRGQDGKFAGVSLKAKGLAELVGLPDFFLELHARFVRLLIQMGMILGQ